MSSFFSTLAQIAGGVLGGMVAGPTGAAIGSGLGKATDKDASLAEILGSAAMGYGGANLMGAGANAAGAAAREGITQGAANAAASESLAGGFGDALAQPGAFGGLSAPPASGLAQISPGMDALVSNPGEAMKGIGDYAMSKEGLLHGVAPMVGGAALSGMFDPTGEQGAQGLPYDSSQKYFAPKIKRTYTPQTADRFGIEQQHFQYAKGGAIPGPTGGMDDLVDTTIEDQVPAKLSHGEFVIPADVVSALGDGNTEAGNSKLYALIKMIREEKFGSPEQPPKLKKGLADLMDKAMS